MNETKAREFIDRLNQVLDSLRNVPENIPSSDTELLRHNARRLMNYILTFERLYINWGLTPEIIFQQCKDDQERQVMQECIKVLDLAALGDFQGAVNYYWHNVGSKLYDD